MAISEKILDFGKNKGQALGACEKSYLKWLAVHARVLRSDHRHFAIAAKALLEEKPVEYTVGQYIKDNKTGKIGKIIGSNPWSYTVKAEYSRATVSKQDALASTEEAYKEQIATAEAELEAARLALKQKQQVKTYRWLCLSCQTKYNGHCCPQCESADRILNNGSDCDRRYGLVS